MSALPGTPFFLEHCPRPLFIIRYDASPDTVFRGDVLHLPAFGEEMNKSRAIVALQARTLAQMGYRVLVPDYSGTGDSAGEFGEASWEHWLEDMRCCLAYLQAQGAGPVTLWGLRLGALMGVELASDARLEISRLLLWNPVLQGELFMQQFLRLRLASSMMSGDGKEKVSDLKQRLSDEGILEVAGYELSAAMFNEVCARKAREMVLPANLEVFWADVALAVKPLPAPAQSLVDSWQEGGLTVGIEQIQASPFWATQEIARADELVKKTTAWLGAQLQHG